MNAPDDDPFADDTELVQAIEQAPPTGEIPLPEAQVFALERARREALATRQPVAPTMPARRKIVLPMWAGGIAAALIALAVAVSLLRPERGSDLASLATARVVVTSPGDVVTDATPQIRWTSRDVADQKYDVWILPAEGDVLTVPALYTANEVTSPVAFENLQATPDSGSGRSLASGSYRVLVCLASVGRHAGVPIPFQVVDDAADTTSTTDTTNTTETEP